MRAEVWVYSNKMDYALDKGAVRPRYADYGEEFYSITEAIEESKKEISQIKKRNRHANNRIFKGFRVYDGYGDVRWELPSEPVTKKDEEYYLMVQAREHTEEKKQRELTN